MRAEPLLRWSVAAPLPAVVVGALVARASGVPWTAFAPNLAVLALGIVVVVIARRRGGERFEVAMTVLASIAIAATLVSPGDDGVHRWLPLGPLRLNASTAFAPLVFVGLVSRHPRARHVALAATFFTSLVHVAQPDAAQAGAFAIAAGELLRKDTFARRVAMPARLALLALGALVWFRPDPLAPLAHVEGIFALAASRGPTWLALAIVAELVAVAPFVLRAARSHPARAATGYFILAIVATFIGNFPVPLLGAGAGPVLGWCAWLLIVERDENVDRG